jgi:drug/metabolite transporter (DMT)-like permease
MASVFLKIGAISMQQFGVVEIMTNVFYILSIGLLFLKAIVWQLSLKKYDLNYVYLFTSCYYPLLLFISYLVFDEVITIGNIFGTLLIIGGIVYLTRPSTHV